MTPHDAHDHLLSNLARLPLLLPDPARAACVRSRCHTKLARIERRSEPATPARGFGRRVLAPVIILGFCGLYVVSLVNTFLHVRGAF